MADKDGAEDSAQVQDVVSDITVKALREFSSGSFDPEDGKEASKGSRPSSAAQGSRPTSAAKGSRPTSADQRSRPTSAAQDHPISLTGSRPPTASRDSKHVSPKGSKPSTPKGSQPVTPVGSRPPSGVRDSRPISASQRSQPQSPAQRSRPQSALGEEGVLVISGSRPGSDLEMAGTPAQSRKSSHPESGDRRASSRQSGAGSRRSVKQDSPEPEDVRFDAMDHDLQESPGLQYTDLMAPMQAPGGGDGGDSGDEDDDNDEEGANVDEEDEEDSDGDTEMVVLDPDHPLMRRFQKALQDHLQKQNEKVSLELRELLEAVKTKRTDREDIGVELYGVQQELARHQMLLERRHDEYSTLNQMRTQMEKQLYDVRTQYRDTQNFSNMERKKAAELQAEVENLALRLFYMDNAKEDVRSDISVMKRAAEKAETEVLTAEMEKQRQDLFVDRLVERVDKLREDIALYEAQIMAQTEETKAAKDALAEAHMEIDAISLEKKQLYQQWNSSLIGMRRRDEAHAAMQEALHQQEQRILSLQTEIEGFKRSISKEQEQNEKLTLILSKTEQDIASIRKMLAVCQAKHDALKNEYATYTRMLHETEQALSRANTDKILRLNEVNALRKLIEKEYLEKVRLEEAILEELRSKLTLDKAAQYTDTIAKKLKTRTRDMDQQIAVVENDISKETLEVSHGKNRVERLEKIFQELDAEIRQKNEIISKSESEITKRNAIIERKQGIIDQYNKKLELMIAQAGGVELGPLEIQINSLHKSIEAEQQEIADLQQMWLRDQNELVQLSKESDKQGMAVTNLKKQLTILSQKRLRIEAEIDSQIGDTNDIKRNIRNMENDMIKLNMHLHKERGTEHVLEQGNVLMENEFIGNLKEAEMSSILMQQKLDSMKEEKERLLNSLVEAERQIMLWEKKTQLAKETRAAVDSEVGQGEVRAMKAEIHRMQVRYTQLMKQQERMIQEMEKSVSRRDTIVTRGDAQVKTNKKVMTKGTFQRQMNELKKKIKSTIHDANNCDEELRELHQHQQILSHQLEEKQLNVQQLQNNSDNLDGDIERYVEMKQKNLADILSKQQKAKYYQQLRDGKYTKLCRTETALENEQQKQVDRMQNLTAIVERLAQEYPHVQPGLRRVLLAFGSRGGLAEDGY